jgi:probable F420-dependent oxidoreductase
MQLGLSLATVRSEHMPALAARAEALGYDAVFVPDHLVFPVTLGSPYPYSSDGTFPIPMDTPLLDPWLLLTLIAGATTRIKLGTAVYLVGLRDPFVTARAVVTLDVLSGGRALFGIGVGWLAEEFTVLGLDPATRASRAEEAVAVIRGLWTDPEPTFAGRHFAHPAVQFEPKPVSSPHPPILVGGESGSALRRAVRIGDGWISGGHMTIAETKRRLDRIGELRDAAGASRPFEVSLIAPRPDRATVEALADLGVDRLVVAPWNRGREAVAAIEAFMDAHRDVVLG